MADERAISEGPAHPGSAETTDAFVADHAAPTVEKPWVIRYVLADLDGTRMPSYSAIGALELLADWLNKTFAQGSKTTLTITRQLAGLVRTELGIELLLHEPEPALQELARRYLQRYHPEAAGHGLTSGFLSTIPGLLDACEASFRLFPGATEFAAKAQECRTAFSIFTATAPLHAVNRMIRAGENPALIREIWTRSKSSTEIAGHIDWQAMTREQRAFITLLRPYKDAKPHPGPLRAVHDQYELRPESVLMIGEGCADLGCVLAMPDQLTPESRLYARFAYQQQGAMSVDAFANINAILREGHPLGSVSFDNLYPDAPLHPGILILQQGFLTLLDLIDKGLLVLKPTPPPIQESTLGVSAYQRMATPAPRRGHASHPIATDDDSA